MNYYRIDCDDIEVDRVGDDLIEAFYAVAKHGKECDGLHSMVYVRVQGPKDEGGTV